MTQIIFEINMTKSIQKRQPNKRLQATYPTGGKKTPPVVYSLALGKSQLVYN